MKAILLTIGLLAFAPAYAQRDGNQGTHQHTAMAHPAGHSPYAEMRNREIKAISEEQISDLRSGGGMSLALPAELNGYPGPAHVLELAEQLELSDTQKKQTQDLFGRMKAEARILGEAFVESEKKLDLLFKEQTASTEAVRSATARAAQAHGELRAAHLTYHLRMMEILTAEQVAAYNRLRGYQR